MKYERVIADLNDDIAKISEYLVATENVEVQNSLFKLLRILKSWRAVLTARKEDYADDTEAPI